jgi:manganese transport protein
MLPSFIVIGMRLDPTRTLVLSQVVLSFGLPFAVIPLIFYTANREIMGGLVNHKITTIAGSLVAALIVALNIFLIYQLLFIGS